MKTVVVQDDYSEKGVLVATSPDMTTEELESFLQRLQAFLDEEEVQLKSHTFYLAK